MKNRIIVDWRDVYDCKHPGENQTETRNKAIEAGYYLFCHNDRILTIDFRQIGYVTQRER